MKFILGIVTSYLLGAVPTAYLYGKISKGIDIREHGSGNVGATNVFRVLGRRPGIIVLLLDIAKGLLAVTVVADLFGLTEVLSRVILALVVVSGHNWTIFLNFRGGKGIASSLGAMIGLAVKIAAIRPVLFLTVGAWLVCFLLTGFVSLSSIAAGVVLPLAMAATGQSIEVICLGVVLGVFILLRHRPNIHRLLSGQEHRVFLPFQKKK